MTAAAWLAGLGGVAALISALFAIWAKISASRTSNVQQVFEAQQLHMGTLTRENNAYREEVKSLRKVIEMDRERFSKEIQSHRERQDHLGQQMAVLHQDRAICERDKLEQERQIRQLRDEVRQLREQMSDG